MTVNDRSVLLSGSQGDSTSSSKKMKQSQGSVLSDFGSFLSQKQTIPPNRPDAFLNANRYGNGSVSKENRFQNQVKERHIIAREQDQLKAGNPGETKRPVDPPKHERDEQKTVPSGYADKEAKDVTEEKSNEEVNYEGMYQDASNELLQETLCESIPLSENISEGEFISLDNEDTLKGEQPLEISLSSDESMQDENRLNDQLIVNPLDHQEQSNPNDLKVNSVESEKVEKTLKTTEDILRTLLSSEDSLAEKEVKKEFSDLIQAKDLVPSEENSEKKVQGNDEAALSKDHESQEDSKDFMQSMQQMILKQPTGLVQEKPVAQTFQNQIYSQVSQTIKSNINLTENGSTMLMKLKPESLGEVELKLSVQRGVVLAEIKVENEMVRAAIEANLDDLKQNLSNKGYDNPSVQVNVQSDGFNEDSLFNSKDQSHLSQSNKSKKGQINLDLDAEFEDVISESDDNAGDLKINYLG